MRIQSSSSPSCSATERTVVRGSESAAISSRRRYDRATETTRDAEGSWRLGDADSDHASRPRHDIIGFQRSGGLLLSDTATGVWVRAGVAQWGVPCSYCSYAAVVSVVFGLYVDSGTTLIGPLSRCHAH